MPVAIITGGAADIGRHLGAGFAREGYVVAALDIQPMSSPHPDIHCFPCDLRDEAAITSVFHTIAQTLGTPRVLINNGAVSPGWIQVDDYDSLSPCDHSQHPSGRVGKPEDVCNACLFLAGEENGFVNGVNLPVDGGMTRRMIYPETDPLWTE